MWKPTASEYSMTGLPKDCFGLTSKSSKARYGHLSTCSIETDGNGILEPRCTVTRAIESKCILTFVGRCNCRLIRYRSQTYEEVCDRMNRLRERSARVTVTLKLYIFEEQRFVAKRRSFPRIGLWNPVSGRTSAVADSADLRKSPVI